MAADIATVTVLFTDLVGSTALGLRVGLDRAEELRQEHFALLREAIAAAKGQEVKNVGDGLMAVFPSAGAAVECAIAAQQRNELRNRRAHEKLELRVGISLGDVSRAEGDYFGSPVVEAARLCAEAAAGQVLVSELTRLMVGRRGNHVFHAVGTLELKGLTDPVSTCELAWEPLAAGTSPLPPHLRVRPETSYVGRETVRGRLSGVWERASAGERQVVLVAGEPGIGKTRLATHIALEAHALGATVLYGRCEEEMAVSYQPWVQALRGLLEHCPLEVLEAHVGEHGGALAVLVPELATRVPQLPPPTATDPETERYMLFGAIGALLQRACADTPSVVVLDDLHWADKQSLALLKHVVAHSIEAPLLLLCTYRDTDTGVDHPLTQLIADLRRERGVEWVELSGFEQHEVESLIAVAAGRELDAEGVKLAEAIRHESAGNPFFVVEILRHMVESGGLVVRDDGRYIVSAQVSNLGIPRSVRDVIGQRLRRLGNDAVAVLSAAAVIGREFDLELLALVTETSEDELLASLEAAAAGSVLSESRVKPGRFTFAHALINHTLYENLSRTRRARMHARIAGAIERLYGDEIDERLGELAHHWSAATQAADRGRAIAHTRRAGEQALAQLAPDEALRWFRQAVEQIATSAYPRDEDRCDLLILTGEAQRQAGDRGYRETLLLAGQVADRLADPDRIARAALANTRGWASMAGALDTGRVAALEVALAAVPLTSPYRPILLAQLASEVCFHWDFHDRVQPLIAEALERSRGDGDRDALARVLSLVSAALTGRPEMLADRLELSGELRALADELGDPFRAFTGAAWRFIASIELAEIAEAHACAHRMRELAEQVDRPWMTWVALTGSTVEAQLAGDLERTEMLARKALAVGVDMGLTDVFTFYGAQISAVRYEQGRLEEIIGGHLAAEGKTTGISAYPAVLAAYLSELGRLDEATTRLDAVAAGGFASLPHDEFLLYSLSHWGLVAVDVRDLGASAALYDLLVPYRAVIVGAVGVVFGSAEMILGRLAAALGRHQEAERHYATAARVHENIGARLLHARTSVYWAQMLLDRDVGDDRDRALALLEGAKGSAEALGGAAVARDANDLLVTARAAA